MFSNFCIIFLCRLLRCSLRKLFSFVSLLFVFATSVLRVDSNYVVLDDGDYDYSFYY